jgi:hypothetical protein
MTSDPGLERGSGFKVTDRVWVKRLNKVGVVQAIERGSRGEVDCYLLQVAVGGSGSLRVLANPLTVEKWLDP